jgi:hypothetical protein
MIEPIDLILRALEAGNAPDIGVQALIPEETMDPYDYFTAMVAQSLQSVGGERLLEYYMGQPELWADSLAKALEEAGADKDDALIDAAQEFLSVMDVRTAARGGYTVDFDDDDLDSEDL